MNFAHHPVQPGNDVGDFFFIQSDLSVQGQGVFQGGGARRGGLDARFPGDFGGQFGAAFDLGKVPLKGLVFPPRLQHHLEGMRFLDHRIPPQVFSRGFKADAVHPVQPVQLSGQVDLGEVQGMAAVVGHVGAEPGRDPLFVNFQFQPERIFGEQPSAARSVRRRRRGRFFQSRFFQARRRGRGRGLEQEDPDQGRPDHSQKNPKSRSAETHGCGPPFPGGSESETVDSGSPVRRSTSATA